MATFTAAEVRRIADYYRTGANLSWWPECPAVFRAEWAETTAMLDAFASLLDAQEQPPADNIHCPVSCGTVGGTPETRCGCPDFVREEPK
jgi:hypothetical protein